MAAAISSARVGSRFSAAAAARAASWLEEIYKNTDLTWEDLKIYITEGPFAINPFDGASHDEIASWLQAPV